MSNSIINVTDHSFNQEVLQANLPVLVDFWAAWCNPCRMLAPVVEEIASQYAGRLKVVKCDVDANPVTPSQYDVRGIPALLLIKDGQVVANKVGAISKSQLTAFIDSHL